MDCDQLEWTPVGSAASHSALAGVLAGLVFAGIVVMLSDSTKVATLQRTHALMLFSGALVTLGLVSFQFGVVAGEQVCPRAWSVMMLAAGLLGLGVLGIFGGISWLFSAYDDHRLQITRLANTMTYTVALVVGLHLQVAAADYLADMERARLVVIPDWLGLAVNAYVYFVVAIIVGFALIRYFATKYQMRHARPKLIRRLWVLGSTWLIETKGRAPIQAAYLALVNVIAVALLSGVLQSRTRAQWMQTPTFVVALTIIVSLAVPTVALLAQLRALPSSLAAEETQCESPVSFSSPRVAPEQKVAASATRVETEHIGAGSLTKHAVAAGNEEAEHMP